MKKLYFTVVCITLFISCRKDSSVSLSATVSGNCLIKETRDENGNLLASITYQDTILTDEIDYENGTVVSSSHIKIENPRQFLYFDGGKTLDKVKTRLYLNANGSLEKEVPVTLNSDGVTFTEDNTKADTYFYNAKKLLTKIDKRYEDDGIIELTYDSKNRVNGVTIKDRNTDEEYFIYDNFQYLDRKKNDNFINIGFTDSWSIILIPCLRNVYITSYDLSSPSFPALNSTYQNIFKFDANGLSQVTAKYTILGQTESFTANVKLMCK